MVGMLILLGGIDTGSSQGVDMGDSYGIWDGCWRRGGVLLSVWFLGG